MKNEEIVYILLKALHVSFTCSYVRESLNRIPYSESLWAICKVLEKYGIENNSYRINSKNDIMAIKLPFIAEMDTGFVVVTGFLVIKLYIKILILLIYRYIK